MIHHNPKKNKLNLAEHTSIPTSPLQNTEDIQDIPIILIQSNEVLDNFNENQDSTQLEEVTVWSPPATPETFSSSQSTLTVDSDFSATSKLPEFVVKSLDIKATLENDFVGNALLLKGKTKQLSNTDRDRISDILISAFLNEYKDRLTHHHFRIISNKIVALIPGEKSSTYFVEPIKKKDSARHKSEPARGKLIEKYRNKLHLIKKIGKEDGPLDNEKNEENSNQTKLGKNSFTE